MAYITQFNNFLDEVVQRRTDQMVRLVLGGHGAPKKFNKKIRNRLRTALLKDASHILTRQKAKLEFRNLTARRRMRYITGYGVRGRFDCIYEWARTHITGPIVYAFWNGQKCLYIGKGQSYKRLRVYKKSIYLKAAGRIEIWEVTSKSKLPSAECLAVHLFGPRDNENKAAKVKWGRKCPICKRHDAFKDELDRLLRLKP